MKWLVIAWGLSMVLYPTAAWTDDFCVYVGGTGEHDFQTAVTAAESNNQDDTIRVVQGTYVGNFSYDSSQGDSLTLEGGYVAGCADRVLAPANTILDGAGSGTVLFLKNMNGGNIQVEGFTIQNGNTAGGGGGIFAACYHPLPGGLSGDVVITDNIVQSNDAGTNGGGIFAGSTPDYGSGGSVTVANNIIADNTAHSYDGGGVFVECLTVSGTLGNIALVNNIVTGNSAGLRGGGVYTYSGSGGGAGGPVTLINNTITANRGGSGGGLYLNLDGNANNCYNNIIWGNTTDDEFDIRMLGTGTVNSYHNDYSTCERTWSYETGRINDDPQFSRNYHLRPGSPCIDSGYNSGLLPGVDFEGDDRVIDGNRDGTPTVDLGADEFAATGVLSPFLWLLLN